MLARCYQYVLDAAVPVFRAGIAALDREMMPPFDVVDLSVTFTALADGVQMRQAVQPDVVRPELFADLVAAMLVLLTRPAGSGATRWSWPISSAASHRPCACQRARRARARRGARSPMRPRRCSRAGRWPRWGWSRWPRRRASARAPCTTSSAR